MKHIYTVSVSSQLFNCGPHICWLSYKMNGSISMIAITSIKAIFTIETCLTLKVNQFSWLKVQSESDHAIKIWNIVEFYNSMNIRELKCY